MNSIKMKSQLSLLALLLLVTACGNSESEISTANQSNEKRVAVYAEEVKPSTFRHYLNIQGDVESDKTIMITPKVNATV